MIDRNRQVLVVGAGFAGAVIARELAEAGLCVTVIDKRPHIAGNSFDSMDASGVRVHRYGPHLFHTSNQRVIAWLSRFTSWLPYEHRVSLLLPNGGTVPLPVNRRTIRAFSADAVRDDASARKALERMCIPHAMPSNAREYLEARIGPAMTELVFGRYTRKMWAMSLDDLDPAVVQRVRIRLDDEDRYFPDDSFQALPADGYEALFTRILAHKVITVRLGTAFRHAMRPDYSHCFLSSPIDEFFGYRYGRLPYRSIRFHHALRRVQEIDARTATVNFSDESPFTRATYWHMLPGHWIQRGTTVLCTTEEPCADHENGFERYYPVKDAAGRNDAIYRRYAALAAEDPGITFIGRCGTYQYLDMHQVINQSLATAQQWLDVRNLGAVPSRRQQAEHS